MCDLRVCTRDAQFGVPAVKLGLPYRLEDIATILIEMLFAHLKRILRLDRLRLRGQFGDRDEFLLAATVQNLRKLAKLIPLPTPQPA